MRRHHVTLLGRSLQVWFDQNPHEIQDGEVHWLGVESLEGDKRLLHVALAERSIAERQLSEQHGIDLTGELVRGIAVAATLNDVDRDPEVLLRSSPSWAIELDAQDVVALVRRPPELDATIRRYVRYRLLDALTRGRLRDRIQFDEVDFLVTGASARDFYRSCEILAGQGDVELFTMAPETPNPELDFRVNPTAQLALSTDPPRGDSQPGSSEYPERLRATAALTPWSESVLDEYSRFQAVETAADLRSVFRAVAPIVETIAVALLRARGLDRNYSSLGQAIADLRNRSIGDQSLWSQLDNVLRFGRNHEQHGVELPPDALRFACVIAFELLVELGSQWPRTDAA